MTGTVTLRLLGKPQIMRDDAPVDVVYNKGMALVAYLAVHPRPHTRDALAGLLWGELPQATANANLRKVLTALREVIGDQLDITRQTVALAPRTSRWTDIEEFQTKLLRLKSTTLEPASLTEPEVQLLADASQLYRGDFLDGFNVRGAIEFEEWVLPQRERLRQMALHALYTLTAYYTARGLYAQGIEAATRLLTLEPWHEEVHRQMMLLLALNGQRSSAMHQYELCREVLRTELGVDPTPDTVALYRRIAAGEITFLPVPSIVLAQQPARPPHNLPEHLTPFTGRVVELHILRDRLSSPQHRLITITGASGVGKTRLALQAASDVMGEFRDGVFYVPVRQADCAGALVPLVIAAVDGRQHRGMAGLIGEDACADDELAGLLTHLKGREILLILDGFEKLWDAGPLLSELLKRLPGLKLLLTSLQPLSITAEGVLPLGGLAWEDNKNASPTGKSGGMAPALQLFDRAAQRTRLDFEMKNGDSAAVSRICELVGGLPLAIELAAGWVSVLSCEAIAREIEHSLDFLTAPARDRIAHHVSLRAALDQSWRHLSGEEQRVLRRLSVLPPGFTREAAAAVAGATLGSLAALADHGLLRRTPFGRYEIHEFIAHYAAELLARAPEEHAEALRHLTEYEGGSAIVLTAAPGIGLEVG